MEMGHLSWPMTHDPWSLHHFTLRMGIGGAWHGGTGQPCRLWEHKYRGLKLSLQLRKIGVIEWVSSLLMSTKNKMGHRQWPIDPLTHFHQGRPGALSLRSMTWPSTPRPRSRTWWVVLEALQGQGHDLGAPSLVTGTAVVSSWIHIDNIFCNIVYIVIFYFSTLPLYCWIKIIISY